jgi:eukaryotic-like serine/threonine-protein kinase
MTADERTIVEVPATAAADSPEHPLFFGERWRAVAMLGTGGMGSVYLARDSELGELVAVKVIRNELARVEGMLERFRDEVRLSRSVSSPYVARTHDLAEHDGRVFLTMQYVEGETLSSRLKREGALPIADVVRLAQDVCTGLSAVHAAGIVHRDLKPGNVLLAKDGRAVITDFGIALRATSAADGRSDGSGTLAYAAPEQLAGGTVDARADVYALGALLYTAGTGQKPFGATRTGREAAPDPRAVSSRIPEAFAAVVVRAMSVDPDQRYETADAVYEALAPLANFGARVESHLFDFVRSIASVSRSIAVELACEGASDVVRDAAAHHLASRLSESGEVRVVAERGAADAVLEGVVTMRDGRCALRLAMRSPEGDVFWRKDLDGSAAALPSLVDAAAISVARALAVSSRPALEGSAFASREAAELFLQARSEYRYAARPHVERAIALFERVDQLEPNNATVLAWRAAALTRRRFFGEGPDLARELIERALALGSREAIPYLALAESCLQDMRVTEAARAFATGLRRAPGMFDGRLRFANFLGELGAFEPALRLVAGLRAEQPSFAASLDLPLRIAALRGRFDEVRAIHESVPAGAMGAALLNVLAVRYAAWSRDPAELRRALAKVDGAHLDLAGRDAYDRMCGAFLDGKPQSPINPELVRHMTPRRRAIAFQVSCEIFAFLRDDVSFFDSLDRGVASGLFDAPWIDSCPLLDPYRGSLHFETARRTVNHRAYDALVEIDRGLGAPP